MKTQSENPSPPPFFLQWRAREIFGAPSGMNEGQPLYNLKPSLQEIVPLCKAAEAHNMIESRKTTGKVLLEIPAL